MSISIHQGQWKFKITGIPDLMEVNGLMSIEAEKEICKITLTTADGVSHLEQITYTKASLMGQMVIHGVRFYLSGQFSNSRFMGKLTTQYGIFDIIAMSDNTCK